MLPDNINQWYVRNASGTMAPLSAYSSTEWTYGSPRLERYNGIPSMEILGEAAAGKSTGDAMKFMADTVAKLPAGVGYSWTGLSYQEALSSNQLPRYMPFHWSWCSSPSPHFMKAGQFRSR